MPHLQQLRRRTLHDLAKSIIDDAQTPGRIGLGDTDDRLAEHRAEVLLLQAQPGLDALARRHVRAQHEPENRRADHEHDQRRKGSSAVAPANGPPPDKVPQTAKPDRMKATVAVSRGSHRNAAHASGSAARKASAPR